MEGRYFDDWTRTIGSRASRRMAIRALLGGIAGGLAAEPWRRQAEAKPPGGLPCRKDGVHCVDDDECCSGVCKKNRCGCKKGLKPCSGDCKQPQTFLSDPLNCGHCGHRCESDEFCSNGQCLCGAPGAPGRECGICETCERGQCVPKCPDKPCCAGVCCDDECCGDVICCECCDHKDGGCCRPKGCAGGQWLGSTWCPKFCCPPDTIGVWDPTQTECSKASYCYEKPWPF